MKISARLILLIGILIAVSAVGTVVLAMKHRPIEYATVSFERGNTVLAEVVSTPADRKKGLSGRDRLPDGRGMLFVFYAEERGTKTFWMKDMKFPIDIIWLARRTVLGIEHNVPPPEDGASPDIRTSPAAVDMVLEIPGGTAELYGITEGQEVEIDFNLDGIPD